MSTIMAITEAFMQPEKMRVCTENDWNEAAVETVNKLGREASLRTRHVYVPIVMLKGMFSLTLCVWVYAHISCVDVL